MQLHFNNLNDEQDLCLDKIILNPMKEPCGSF